MLSPGPADVKGRHGKDISIYTKPKLLVLTARRSFCRRISFDE